MKPLLAKIRPTEGFSQIVHLALRVILPITLFAMVRLQFVQLAFILIILSKWRIFAVRPRFWMANIRANSVDLIVGISVVLFMIHSNSALLQLFWVILYSIWLILIKPATNLLMISVQAFLGQLAGLMALYVAWAAGPLYGLTIITALICYVSARHFFDGFEETYSKLLSYIWAYFGAALAWLLGHWLLFYKFVSQPTLLLSTIGYGMAVLYYLNHGDKLSKNIQRQFLFIMLAIVIVVVSFSDWGNKVI